MSVHLNLRNGKIRTDDKEDIVQTAAPAAQETAAQTSADYERQVRLNLKKGTVSYGGKSYGLSHEGTSNAGSQALQERIDARSREQKARTGNIWQAQSQTANRQSTEARQEETARQKVITMLAAGAAGLGSRSTGSARGTASSYLQGGGSTGGSAYAAALSAPAGRTQRYVSGREQLGQDILNLNRRQDAEQALGSRVMSDTARTDTLEQAARDTVIDAMVRQAQAGGQTQADKARAFDQVNAWLDENPEAKTLWDAERGAGRGNPAAQRAAQRIRAGMSEEEERAYEQAGELYDSYGSAWSAAHRLGSDVKGLAQQAAGSWATLAESIAPATRDEAANNSAERHALAELRRLTDEGKVFETDENGQIRTSDEYEAALARYNAAKEAGPQDNQKTVLTDENSAGMRLYHEGGENLAKAQAGLGSAARFGADTANAIAGNLPNMALALIPGVGPAVSLGALGAQAAGGRMAELYDEDTGADEALWRGLVSGGIEVGTEVLPVGSWVEIVNRGGKGLVRNLLQQMGEEGTEEAVGYVVNYLADVAAKDPNAEFSWAELAQNAGMGAISGGFYGAAGTGLNLALNRANTRMAENLAGGENQVQQANTRTAQAVREAALTQAQDMQQAVADPLGAAARLEEETRPGSTAAEEKYAPQAAQSAQESAQNADGELAARQAENAAQAAADALAQEKAAQDADTLTGEEAAQRADAQAVSEAALAQAAAERYAQESAPQADTVALERGTVRRETVEGIQAFADAEESYTPYMKKALVERYKGQSPAVYVQEMHSMYNAGREGVLSFEQAKSASAARAAVVQDDAALYTAYSLGRNAASALTVQQPAAAVTEPEVRYDGVPAGSAQVPDAVLQGVAEKFGMNVDVVRQLTADNGGEVNGYWAAGAAALTVGENSANAYQTVQHELTHWMEGENPEGWARLRARTMAFAASEYGLGGVQQHIGRYESSYGDRTQAADEYARDLFAGIMSSEENTRAFVEYVSEDSETTREEKRSVLQALREMLDKIVGSIRSLLRGGDATLGAADGRRLAERAENAEKARAVCDEALAELETARRNARARLEAAGQADSDTKNAPAASEGVKYSINPEFARELDEWNDGGREERKTFTLGTTGEALKSIGVADRSIVMLSGKIRKILRDHPNMTLDMVKQIPAMLENPVLVLESQGQSMRPGTRKNSRIVVVGNVTDANGAPVLCVMDLAPGTGTDRKLGLQDFNKVSSAYPKDVNPRGFLEKSNVLYAEPDMEKTGAALSAFGFKLATSAPGSTSVIGSITYENGDVKIKGVPFTEIFGNENKTKDMDTETTAGFGEGLRYSAPTEADYDDLRAQNRELAQKNLYMEQQMEVLRQEFKASGGHSVSRASARGIAQRILKLTGSKYGVDRLSGDLWRVFNVEGNGEPTLNADAMDALTDVMRGVLNESEQKNTELREYYKPLRETLRGTTLEVRRDSAEFAELMNAYGDGKNGRQWGNVRKALFGRLNVRLTDGAGNWDTMQAELAESWPGTFDAENTDITAFTDAVLGVYEASVPVVENPYGMDMETLALDLANEAVEGYLNSPTRRTMADRAAQDAQKAARAEYRKGRRDAQAEMKALYDQAYANRKERFDAMLEVYKQKAQNAKDDAVMRERMQKLKWVQTRDKKLVRQQAEFATRMQRRNDGLLYRKSRDSAQKQVRTLAAWLREPTDTKHVPKKMRTAVLNVLNLFDWNTSNAGTATAQRWQETMKDIALMAKDAEALEHMGAGAGDYADFDPSLPGYIDTLLQQTGGKTGIGQFSGEQMRQLDVILKSMTKSITQANKLLAEGSRETIAAAGDASVAEMAAREKQQVKNKNNLLGKAVKAAADTTAGDALGQLLGVDMMDAGRYFAALGDTAEQMYRPIREGFDKRAWKLRETVEWTQALLKDKTDVDKWTGRKAEKRKFTVTDAASMADTVLELTPGQAMELYCLSQRAAAKEHLMIGGIQLKDAKGKPGRRVKLTPGQLAEITGSLTTEQVQTARAMQEYLSTTAAAWGNEVSNTLYGYDKFTETHYWPMSSSNDFTATTAASSRQAGLNGIKNAGMTKALVKGANNPLVVGDAFDTFFGHTTEMATYYGWCIPLSDMMKWYNWRAPESAVSVKEGIDNLLGRKGKDYFETLMRDINGQGRAETASGGERLMNTVTRNWKVAKVGANLRVAVQQPTAYFRAGAEIAPKYLRGALGRGAANLGKGLAARAKGQTFEGGMAKAEKYCAIAWWKSQGYFETNLGKDVRAMALDEETALERVRSASTAMAEWGDKTTWGALWNACELETLDKHPELEYDSEEFNRQCAARLSEIVDKTQVVDSVLHRSQIMRSTDVWTKVLTNFMAEPIKSYAMVAQAAVNLAQNPKDKAARARFARVGVTYVATAMATAAAAATVDTLRHPRGDDEDDGERLTAASLAKVYAQNVLENFADGVNLPGNLPLLQDIIGFITERADGNATYTIKRNDVEWIGDVMDAVSVWNKYLTGKTTSLYQVLYRTANAVSNVTGVAVSAALRDVKGVYDTLTGLAGADDPLGMDKDLNRIALALDGGDADKASRLFAGQVDAKVKSGTDPADAVTAARSTVTKLYSKAYQQADSEERAEMLDALMGLEYGGERVYDLDTVTGWGVTVGSADITAALDTADADAVQEMIDERVRQLERADEEAAAQASRMMEAGTLTREEYDSVLDSARDAKELRTAIRSAITKEMKPRYQAADTAGRQEIAEMLCRLKVDGLTVYEADDFKKWE